MFGVAVPQLTPKQFGMVLFWSAVGSGAAYVRQSPWAKAEDDTKSWRNASNTGTEAPVELLPAPSGGGAPVTPKAP